MPKVKKPKKWTEVYPAGTPAGDEESRFFIALARNPKYDWRSSAALAKEANLSKERTEEIISKYFKKGMVFQNPANEDQWGYWERVPQMLPKDHKSLAQKDQEDRINKAMNSEIKSTDFKLYQDPLMPPGQMLMGYKGQWRELDRHEFIGHVTAFDVILPKTDVIASPKIVWSPKKVKYNIPKNTKLGLRDELNKNDDIPLDSKSDEWLKAKAVNPSVVPKQPETTEFRKAKNDLLRRLYPNLFPNQSESGTSFLAFEFK